MHTSSLHVQHSSGMWWGPPRGWRAQGYAYAHACSPILTFLWACDTHTLRLIIPAELCRAAESCRSIESYRHPSSGRTSTTGSEDAVQHTCPLQGLAAAAAAAGAENGAAVHCAGASSSSHAPPRGEQCPVPVAAAQSSLPVGVPGACSGEEGAAAEAIAWLSASRGNPLKRRASVDDAGLAAGMATSAASAPTPSAVPAMAFPTAKRQRLSSEQMADLVASVQHHVQANPDRYTTLVIADMAAKYPGLELNMGQVCYCLSACLLACLPAHQLCVSLHAPSQPRPKSPPFTTATTAFFFL